MEKQNIEELEIESEKLMARERYNDVINFLERNKEIIPISTKLTKAYMNSLSWTNQKDKVIENARIWSRQFPTRPDFKFQLGWELAIQGHHKEAIPILEEALKYSSLKPLESGIIMKALGTSYNKIGKFKRSLELYRQSQALGAPTLFWDQLHALEDVVGIGYAEEAIPHLEKLLAHTKYEKDIRKALLFAYETLADTEKSIEQLIRITALDPEDDVSKSSKYYYFSLMGNQDRSVAEAQDDLEKNPQSSKRMWLLAQAYRLKQEASPERFSLLTKASRLLDESLSREPESIGALVEKGLVHINKEEYSSAEKTISRIGELKPDLPTQYELNAILLMKQERNYEAILSIIDAISLQSPDGQPITISLQKLLRKAMIKMPETSVAIRDLTKMFKENAQDSTTGLLLTTMLDYVKDEQQADEISRLVINKLMAEKTLPNTLRQIEYKSKNPVKYSFINVLSPNLYVVKTENPELNPREERARLEREYTITRSLSTASDKVPKMLACNYGFLFERRIKAPNLDQLHIADLNTQRVQDEFRKSLESLAEIQITGEQQLRTDGIKLPKHDYEANLRRRLINRFGIKPKLEAFHQQYMKFFNEQLTSIPDKEIFNSLIHRNAHAGNTLVGGYWVDWESPALGNPLIDAAELLNNPKYPDIKPEELAKEYIQTFLALKQQTGTKLPRGIEQSAQQLYSITKLHNHIELIGSMLATERYSGAEYHYDNARELLGSMNAPEIQNLLNDALIQKNS